MLSIAGLLACLACGGDSSSPALVATPSDVAFGDVYLGGSTSRTITLTNASGQALTITDVNSTGSALVTSGQALPLTLPPGESTDLAVELVPSATGEIAGAVTVASTDSLSSAVVKHLGKGIHPSSLMSAAPGAIAFGTVAVGDRALQQVTLTNGSERDVTITNLIAIGSGVSASVPALPFTVRAGESASVAVAFAPTAAGDVTGQVAVRSDQPHPMAIVALSGSGAVSATPVSVVASPPALEFGDVTVGDFSARTVALTNMSAEPVAISQLETSGAGFSVSGLQLPATLDPGTSATLTVRFSPAALGSSSGTLSVRSPAQPDALTVISYDANGVPFASITSVSVRDATVLANGSVQMSADVVAAGTIDKSVTWTLDSGALGSIDAATGVYTAPSTPGTYRVWATSKADPAKRGSGAVTVSAPAPVSVSVNPTTASLAAGATTNFSATVTATTNTAVNWSIQEGAAGGSITPAGVYTAPATAGTYHVVATSSADGSKSTTATVTVIAPAAPPPSSPPSNGPQFYVATNGNDSNPGTEAQPWRTIQKAMNSATPGSTVNIRGGTYNERLTMNVQGTAGNYITFQPYGFSGAPNCGGYTGVTCGGEKVILDYAYLGTNTSATPLLYMSSKSYIRIQGITFQNFTCDGAMQQMVRVDGLSAYVEFKHNRVLNSKNISGQAGLHVTALSPFRVFGKAAGGGPGGAHHITVYGNEFGNIQATDGEVLVSYGAPNCVFEKNWIHDADAIGIDIQQGADNCIVRGNRLEYVAKKRDGSLFYPGAYSAGIYFSGTANSVMEGNSCNYCANAIQMVSEPGLPPTRDSIVRNNVVTNSSAGIVIGTWYSNVDDGTIYNISAYNNTFYGNSVGIQIRPFRAETVRWKNNAFVNNGVNYANSGGWSPGIADYNLYYGGGNGPDARPVLANPQFTNPGAGDFTPMAGSPAVDAGDPSASTAEVGTGDFAGRSRIMGGRVDVGAHEKQ